MFWDLLSMQMCFKVNALLFWALVLYCWYCDIWAHFSAAHKTKMRKTVQKYTIFLTELIFRIIIDIKYYVASNNSFAGQECIYIYIYVL